MLTLCGFSASNYYNKVKLALLEKGVPFTEELAWVGQTDPQASPMIWFSNPQTSAKATLPSCFMGCALACLARQSNDFGWWHST